VINVPQALTRLQSQKNHIQKPAPSHDVPFYPTGDESVTSPHIETLAESSLFVNPCKTTIYFGTYSPQMCHFP